MSTCICCSLYYCHHEKSAEMTYLLCASMFKTSPLTGHRTNLGNLYSDQIRSFNVVSRGVCGGMSV